MKLYYINRNPSLNGNHELHVATCNNLPNIFNRKYLGEYSTLSEATREAQKQYPNTIPCNNCIEQTIEKPIPFFKKWFPRK